MATVAGLLVFGAGRVFGSATPVAEEQVAPSAIELGGRCDRLLEMTEEERLELILPQRRSQWPQFCRVAAGQVCDDYGMVLSDYGTLRRSEGPDAAICAFEPYFETERLFQEWPPQYRNIGSLPSLRPGIL